MRTLTKVVLVTSAFALAACSNGQFNNPFKRGGSNVEDTFPADQGISTAALDPASPAFFAESIGNTVLFPVAQSTLSDEARATLSQQAQWLLTNTTYTAIIEGHADEQGTREYNLGLGSRRASAARDFLVSQGVADSRLQIITYGKERPLAVCSTEECYSKNRRAVTVISAGAAS